MIFPKKKELRYLIYTNKRLFFTIILIFIIIILSFIMFFEKKSFEDNLTTVTNKDLRDIKVDSKCGHENQGLIVQDPNDSSIYLSCTKLEDSCPKFVWKVYNE